MNKLCSDCGEHERHVSSGGKILAYCIECNRRRWRAYKTPKNEGLPVTEADKDLRGSPKATVWNGTEYRSMKDAAEALGVGVARLGRWLDQGYVCDTDIPDPDKARSGKRGNPVGATWNGTKYHSIKDAAQSLGISYTAMKKRVANGYTCDDDLPVPSRPKRRTSSDAKIVKRVNKHDTVITAKPVKRMSSDEQIRLRMALIESRLECARLRKLLEAQDD